MISKPDTALQTTTPRRKYKAKRRGVFDRPVIDEVPPLDKLTKKQVEIIIALAKYVVLPEPQILRLSFPSPASKSYCQELLAELFQHHYVWRKKLPYEHPVWGRPLVYFLDVRGVSLMDDMEVAVRELMEWGFKEWEPEERNMSMNSYPHLLEQHDVAISFELAARAMGMTIEKFLNEPTLRSAHMEPDEMVAITGPRGGKKKVSVIADFYFHLNTGVKPLRHFVELDRGTRAGQYKKWGDRDWHRKIAAYVKYYASGKYEDRYGSKQGRVLTVVAAGQRRMKNLIDTTVKAGGRHRFWFTTYEQLMALPIPEAFTSPIWLMAGEQERGLKPLLKPEWIS